ncbi:MAG TPA: hypothetical protein VKH46_16840 [Thermoanaerobaculia bacterium]|jgi:hypothetical protein|nr:hypothetical protein [Thermoanaerobaculia bacterium]
MPRSRSVIAFAAVAALAAFAFADSGALRREFDSDAAGGTPAFFRFEGTPGLAPEKWKSMPDANALSRPMVAVQTDATGQPGHFHFALSTQASSFADGSVQAASRRAAAKGFARGGVVIRYQNPANFVAALVDFQSDTVTAVSVRDGKAQTLGAAPIRSNEPMWRTVRLAAAGDRLEISVSGQKAIEARDPRPHPGAAGLVAEAPVPVAFDDVVFERR